MTHVCVIGGGGFIGKALVNHLLSIGRRVTVIGRNRTSPFNSVVSYFADNGSADFIQKSLRNVDEVIHLAYSTTPKTSFDNPVSDIVDNLTYSVKLFESLLNSNVKKVLYVSSGGTVYGHTNEARITEDHSTDPISPYGITKLAIEKYARMFYITNGLPVTIIRPANAYGEGQLAFRGQGFIPTAIASIIRQQDVTIFGQEGTVRDYIHVNDVVSSIIAVLQHGEIGQCYNAGTGIGMTNLAIYKMIALILKEKGFIANCKIAEDRLFDVRTNILDSNKLYGKSGWKPEVAIEDGLNRTTNWFLSNG